MLVEKLFVTDKAVLANLLFAVDCVSLTKQHLFFSQRRFVIQLDTLNDEIALRSSNQSGSSDQA